MVTVTITGGDKLTGLLAQWAALCEKDTETALRDEMRLLVQKVIELTPPVTGRGKASGAKSAGETKIKGDILRLFQSAGKSEWEQGQLKNARAVAERMRNPKVAEALRRLSAKGDLDGLRRVLGNIGIHGGTVIHAANEALHTYARNRRGSVKKGVSPYYVTNADTIARLMASKVAHLGKAKAGWNEAAKHFGVKSAGSWPSWVKRHAGEGGFRERKIRGASLVLVATNRNKGATNADAINQVVDRAVLGRSMALERNIERVLSRNVARFSRL